MTAVTEPCGVNPIRSLPRRRRAASTTTAEEGGAAAPAPGAEEDVLGVEGVVLGELEAGVLADLWLEPPQPPWKAASRLASTMQIPLRTVSMLAKPAHSRLVRQRAPARA